MPLDKKDENRKILYNYIKEAQEKHKDEEPIYKGCPNKECFCTGACKEIVGWQPKRKYTLHN